MAPLVPMEDERELRESLTRRMCCIGDHERVQKKTFTRWLNKHERISIEDLYDDLKDGKVLIALLELLSGDVIVHDQSPHSQNVQSMEAVLSFLKQQQARIVNIRSFDITVGNPKLTLSLIWTVILHYQVSVPGEQVELLTWAQQVVGNQPGLPCHDLSSCWQDGRLFNTILHRIRPGLVDLEAVHHQSNKQNLQQAFATAERHLGIPQLLDPEDVDVNSPDERSIATYLAVLRQAAEGYLPQDGKKLGEGPEDVQSLKKQPPLPSVQDSQRYTHGGVTKEDKACLTFITELQAWVDMNQKEVNATNFGEDLKEVATLVEEQNASHDAIEELRKSLEEAQQCKESLSASCRADYDKRFDVLQRSYNVLVSSSNKCRRQLQELLTFLRAATDKLTWLGSCEDRQVSLDWSDNCPQLNDRQEDYVLLMQEMARQDPAFHGILEQGEELLQEGHPACRLLEGYIDALQTQWSWLLQLDSCTEMHLQKNAEYFQFFRDSQSLHQELTSLHDSLVQECSCDCDSDVVHLSKALDSNQNKSERLSELHAGVAKLSKKADKVVQLKPRRADYVLESSIPICAICDYKQSKVTLVKNSMYKLEGLHENGKWSIQDSDGRHALVPSVCFIVPPPNVEAGERARRLEEQQLEVEHLLKQQKLDMEAILSWHHMQDTIKSINSWTPCSFQDLSEEVCNSVLDRLENQSSDFKEKIKGSRVFPPEKLRQLEKDASSCKHHYQALLNNLVSEENEEQTYRQLLTELQAAGDRLMSLQDEVVQVVKEQSADSSLDNMPSMLTRQERLDQEVDNLGTRLDQIGQQCEPLLNHASRAPSQADLRAELDRCLQIRPHLSDLSTSSLDRLRSLKQVRSIMTGLELHLVKFETSLAEQSSVPTNAQAIEQYQQSVKGMRADLSRHSGTLQSLQDEVSRAHSATEGLSRLEPCAGNLEPVAEAARLLHQRWRDVGSQMDSRLCELDHLSLLLAEYRESYDCVIQWLLGVSAQQDLSQIRQGKSSRELQSHLIQQKALIAKVERTQEEVTRCHELSEKYCNAVKEYEAKLAAYRDLVESITGEVLDHRPTSSALNNIEKEVVSLLDRYASLLNLTKDNAKLLGEALQQAQENEFAETAVTHVQWITEMEERMTSMRVASLDQVHLLAGSPSEQTNQLLIESLQKKSMESPNGSLQDLLCLYDEVETKMKSIHQELTQRQGMTEQLCCLASDLSALVNSSWAETRASEVKSRLVAATDLACSHLVRIHEDWQKAKSFQNAAQDHLVWCLDAEQALKALDLSGDEGSFQNVSKQLTDWMQKLESQHFILAESESMAEDILHVCPPGGAAIILRWARIIRGRFDEVQACANGIQTRIAANRFALEKDTRRAEELMSWLASMQDMMAEEEIEPEKAEVTKECLARHQALVTEMTALQPEVDRLVRLYRRRGLSDPLSPISSSSTLSPSTPSTQPDFRSGTSPGSQVSNQSSPPVPMGCSSPQLQPLLTLWQRVWLAVLDRQGRLRETQNNPQEKKEDKKDNEDFFTTWGWRCLQWAGHRRLRVLDYFCRLDKDQDGLIHCQDFIQALLDSKTGINDEEATTIARMFEKGGGLVDYYELVEALTSAPTRGQPQTDADKIDDEVTRKVAACRCPKRFQVEQIEENKYRFGESQQLRLVRILRSAVMVRVGGGWSSLDEFLLKNDPCRASVDGCSTMDMRNRLTVPDGKGLTAASFQPKPRRSPLGRSPSAPSLPQQISGAPAIINPKGKVSRASSQRSVKSRTPVAKTSQSSASSPSNRSGCSSKKLSRSRSLGKPEDLMAWETVASPVYSQTDIAHQSESRQVHTGAHQPNGKSSRIPTAMPTSALSRKTSNRWR